MAAKLLKNGRVIILIFALICALLAIWPSPFREGVAIQAVDKESNAYSQGISADPSIRPTAREVITLIDSQKISNTEDFYKAVDNLKSNITVRVETNKNIYRIKTDESGSLGLSITDASKTNIRKGLDLQGGTRVFLQPVEKVDDSVLDQIVESLKLRLNTFGLSDIIVKKITTPEQFIIVEIAGATQEEVKELILSQGVFEAKIANNTVFTGDDIKFVGLGAQDARITSCTPGGDGYFCEFQFSLTISEQAAKQFSAETLKLEVEGEYLSSPLDLFLDGSSISNLSIVSNLRGREITNPSVTGSGAGRTRDEAYGSALAEMSRLQTILESGSLPVKLKVERSFTISPVLGKEFGKNTFIVGLLSILGVAIFIFIRYRKFIVSIPIIICMTSEIFLMLGLAAVVSWQLDLAAIAGIIIAAGTGVDDQIVITEEVLRGDAQQKMLGWKKKMGRAFFIIFAAYFATVASMIPLWWAGAGLLKGFAFTTIAGITFGVFITRPAFAAIVEHFYNKNN